MLVRVMESLASKKPRKIIASQGYRVMAFQETAKKKVRVTVSLLSKKPRQKNYSQDYGVVAFSISTTEKCGLGLWYSGSRKSPCQLGLRCLEFPRSHKRKMLVRVMVYWLSQKTQKKNLSQDYHVVAFPVAVKKTCQLGLSCRGFPRNQQKNYQVGL